MKYLKKFKLFEDISKRSSKEDVLKALSEIKTLGTVNPIDGRDMYIDGINIELRYWDGYLWIGSIYVISEERGQGKATRLIQKICDIADKYGVFIGLTPTQFGNDKNALNDEQLENFYKKFGFKEKDDIDIFEREPKK